MTDRGMSRAVRGELEAIFDAGFGDVRLHQGALAAGGVPGAVACTRGSDIRFAAGSYDPRSPEGMDVLGHELAHVLQQRYGRAHAGADGRALEAEAAEAGRRAARGEPVHIPGRPRRAYDAREMVTQYYTVVPPAARVANNLAVVNPQHNAPTQPHDTFVGQDKGVGAAASSFLHLGVVRLVSTPAGNATIRVSANGRLAIEDCDTGSRQPKAFYATASVITMSNNRLRLLGSPIRLDSDPAGGNQQSITVGARTLLRVTPRNKKGPSAGFAMDAPQACDNLVGEVLGTASGFLKPRFQSALHVPYHNLIEYHVARALLPPPPLPVLDDTSAVFRGDTARAIAIAYGTAAGAPTPGFTLDLQRYGLNQFAPPGVGEAFVTASLTAGVAGSSLAQGALPTTVTDYHAPIGGLNPVVQKNRTWGSHWGGVVARDGSDVVTLENYARKVEDASEVNDTRYYFQMYQTDPASPGQTWHDAWTTTPMQAIAVPPAAVHPNLAPTHEPVSPGAQSFTNPITMRVTVPAARWDTVADKTYALVPFNTIKDDHQLIATAGAATRHAEALEIMKGLRYANDCLAAARWGDRACLTAWINALTAAAVANRYRENAHLIEHTHERTVLALAQTV